MCLLIRPSLFFCPLYPRISLFLSIPPQLVVPVLTSTVTDVGNEYLLHRYTLASGCVSFCPVLWGMSFPLALFSDPTPALVDHPTRPSPFSFRSGFFLTLEISVRQWRALFVLPNSSCFLSETMQGSVFRTLAPLLRTVFSLHPPARTFFFLGLASFLCFQIWLALDRDPVFPSPSRCFLSFRSPSSPVRTLIGVCPIGSRPTVTFSASFFCLRTTGCPQVPHPLCSLFFRPFLFTFSSGGGVLRL